ncbi:MAG: glycoside hydrolase family 95 protein [Phycisphaerae bacterium]|nr:glycoside hydrolase family 95 protein [Phycisphaerae bacterium]
MKNHYTLTAVSLYSVLLLVTLSTTGFSSTTDAIYEYVMWYDKPADDYGLNSPLKCWEVENPNRTHKTNPDQAWEKYALPLGNGFIGAMVYGGVGLERIQLNEHSLWSGGPGSPGWNPDQNKHDAHEHLAEIRKALLAGENKKAQDLSTEHLRGLGSDDRNTADINFGRYETFGELHISTGQDGKAISDYRRELNLSTGLHTVNYNLGGTRFTRTVFCSNPDRCLVVHFASDKPGQQNLHLKLATPHEIKMKPQDGVFVASGKVKNNGLKLDARIGVLHNGGEVVIGNEGIQILKADDITFVLVLDTDYAPTWPNYRGNDPRTINKDRLKNAMSMGYDKLKANHVTDHQSLHGRVAIDLGNTSEDVRKLPTDQRVKYNKQTPDHDLEGLYFQYGRYLLIASSRPGGVPANLQGIWCNERIPAWNSDYHLNINLQMNYWPCGPCNLLECQEPLITYTDSLRKPGAVTARAYLNADGWMANLSSNLWGYTIPHPGKNRPRYWSYFPLGGAWLTTHAFEQYAFGCDEQYLRKTSWPILASTADFLVDLLYELPTGELSSTPSWSPEHGPISKGATCDIAMAREALNGAIIAAEILGESGPRVDSWKQAMAKLVPYKIGNYGQLQEWYEDVDNIKDTHRHINHLFGTFPGHQISMAKTPKLAEATRLVMERRGYGIYGWSIGWQIGLASRLRDSERAYTVLRNLMSKPTQANLFNATQAFQIDGNFGGTAGIAEMLLQSQYLPDGGEIDLLPALPKAWPNGSVKGLRARGGFVVDMTWKNGKLTEATIKADKASKLTVRWLDKTWSRELAVGQSVTFNCLTQ